MQQFRNIGFTLRQQGDKGLFILGLANFDGHGHIGHGCGTVGVFRANGHKMLARCKRPFGNDHPFTIRIGRCRAEDDVTFKHGDFGVGSGLSGENSLAGRRDLGQIDADPGFGRAIRLGFGGRRLRRRGFGIRVCGRIRRAVIRRRSGCHHRLPGIGLRLDRLRFTIVEKHDCQRDNRYGGTATDQNICQ